MVLDDIIKGYVECAIWASGLDNADEYSADDLTELARQQMIKDCRWFYNENKELFDSLNDAEKIGHDFWLSRNGHGSGFFDSEYIYGEENAKSLQKQAKRYGECHIYIGRAGKLSLFTG